MAHRYGEVVLARLVGRRAPSAPNIHPGEVGDTVPPPAAFAWRGVWYQVDAILATWRLRDGWWAAPSADVASVTPIAPMGAFAQPDAQPPTDRTYYRVRCVDPDGEQIFDLYYDAISGQWVLDRAHD